jgi:O-antigen/teichoic acid export membrane protein
MDAENKQGSIAGKFLWTIGLYAGSLGVKFSTSIFLSRLLGAEILGVMVVAHAVRAGAQLFADLGLEQHAIHYPQGGDGNYLNTAWTVQIVRGLLMSLGCLALSPLLSHLYEIPVEVLFAVSAAPLLNSLASTAMFTLSRNLDVKIRNLFEFVVELFGLAVNIGLAIIMPSVWAPVLAILLTVAFRSILSFALPHQPHRLLLVREHVLSILRFGRWIALSSLTLYLSLYVDRLYIGQAVPIALLGVYGLARSVTDLPPVLANRLGYQIVFPVIAAERNGNGGSLGQELFTSRQHFVLLAALGMAILLGWSDWAIRILYGAAFAQGGWMLFLLLWGTWAAFLSGLNEAAVMGKGKPHVVSMINVARIVGMLAALPLGFALGGLPGAILALSVVETSRYLLIAAAQWYLGASFLRQDALGTGVMIAVAAAFVAARAYLGLGMPWQGIA